MQESAGTPGGAASSNSQVDGRNGEGGNDASQGSGSGSSSQSMVLGLAIALPFTAALSCIAALAFVKWKQRQGAFQTHPDTSQVPEPPVSTSVRLARHRERLAAALAQQDDSTGTDTAQGTPRSFQRLVLQNMPMSTSLREPPQSAGGPPEAEEHDPAAVPQAVAPRADNYMAAQQAASYQLPSRSRHPRSTGGGTLRVPGQARRVSAAGPRPSHGVAHMQPQEQHQHQLRQQHLQPHRHPPHYLQQYQQGQHYQQEQPASAYNSDSGNSASQPSYFTPQPPPQPQVASQNAFVLNYNLQASDANSRRTPLSTAPAAPPPVVRTAGSPLLTRDQAFWSMPRAPAQGAEVAVKRPRAPVLTPGPPAAPAAPASANAGSGPAALDVWNPSDLALWRLAETPRDSPLWTDQEQAMLSPPSPMVLHARQQQPVMPPASAQAASNGRAHTLGPGVPPRAPRVQRVPTVVTSDAGSSEQLLAAVHATDRGGSNATKGDSKYAQPAAYIADPGHPPGGMAAVKVHQHRHTVGHGPQQMSAEAADRAASTPQEAADYLLDVLMKDLQEREQQMRHEAAR